MAGKGRSFFSSWFWKGSKTYLYQQAFQALGASLVQVVDRVVKKYREEDPSVWQDRILAMNLMLELEAPVRNKFTRLLGHLHQQGRYDDLKAIQTFLSAARISTDPASDVPKMVAHIAGLVGDSGEEADYAEAINFLSGMRIIGIPEGRRPDRGKSEERSDLGIVKTLDTLTDWFRRDLQQRREKRQGRKTRKRSRGAE